MQWFPRKYGRFFPLIKPFFFIDLDLILSQGASFEEDRDADVFEVDLPIEAL